MRSGVCLKNHTASLLTNYRCHSSILSFTSSLFYQHTLLSRSSSETHPLAPYPLVFTCTSIDDNIKNLPDEDLHEARVLVDKMFSFISKWPQSKPKQSKSKQSKRPTIGLLASTRKQVNSSFLSANLCVSLFFCNRWKSLGKKCLKKESTYHTYHVMWMSNRLTSFKVILNIIFCS